MLHPDENQNEVISGGHKQCYSENEFNFTYLNPVTMKPNSTASFPDHHSNNANMFLNHGTLSIDLDIINKPNNNQFQEFYPQSNDMINYPRSRYTPMMVSSVSGYNNVQHISPYQVAGSYSPYDQYSQYHPDHFPADSTATPYYSSASYTPRGQRYNAPDTSDENSQVLLHKLEQSGRVPSREKFRRMICQVLHRNHIIQKVYFNLFNLRRHTYAVVAVHTTRDVSK